LLLEKVKCRRGLRLGRRAVGRLSARASAPALALDAIALAFRRRAFASWP